MWEGRTAVKTVVWYMIIHFPPVCNLPFANILTTALQADQNHDSESCQILTLGKITSSVN